MSKGNTFENDLLKLIFNGTAIANIADNAGSGPLSDLYVSLHTGDPGEAGDQETNECAYTDYARVAVARSGSGFTVSGNQVVPAAAITFPEATGGSETATHFAICTASTGAGKILYKGAISPTIVISTGVTPRLTTAPAKTDSEGFVADRAARWATEEAPPTQPTPEEMLKQVLADTPREVVKETLIMTDEDLDRVLSGSKR
jgi:hypothetical protein